MRIEHALAIALVLLSIVAPSAARADYLYAADSGNGTVYQIAPDGSVSTLTSLVTSSSMELAADGAGDMYVLANANVWQLGAGKEMVFAQTGGFVGPIAADHRGNLYLADINTPYISRIAPDGSFTLLTTLPTSGITADAGGNLYVNGGWNTRAPSIYEITTTGTVSPYNT